MTRSPIRIVGGGVLLLLVVVGVFLFGPAGIGPSTTGAAGFTIDSTADAYDASPGDGVCATAGGACTLRAAVQEANALAGADAIAMPAGTYYLILGRLTITSELTVDGAGASTTIIDGSGFYQIFEIAPGATVEISDLTIRNGQGVRGGGIRNEGVAVLNNLTVTENDASVAGGVSNVGIMTVNDSRLVGNTSGTMGGIGNEYGESGGAVLTINNSVISGNVTKSTAGIGNNLDGTVTINNSTISNNTAEFFTGGIGNDTGGFIFINNSTIAGNSSGLSKGGIGNSGTMTLKNTIVADNTQDDCSGTVTSAGHNLDSDGTCGFAAAGDISNTDPLLGPLADNGGPTQTHALLPGSPAINAGSNDCPPPATDQRGYARSAGACDIGAFEVGALAPTPTATQTPCGGPCPTPTPAITSTPTLTPTPCPADGCPTSTPTPTPTPIGKLAIASGAYHSCAITAGGGVQCWGANFYGMLGDGTTTNRDVAVDVTGLQSGVVAIAAGNFHTCAVTTAGALKCWGYDVLGAVGNGHVCADFRCKTPMDVTGLGSGVAAVSGGGQFTCALTTGGAVKCWGDNREGQLGVGNTSGPEQCSFGSFSFACSTTPVDVVGLASGVAEIKSGGAHSCALTTVGGVKCWGRNSSGQVGDGTKSLRSSPVNVTGLGSGVDAITSGIFHSCALSGGGVQCWGADKYGQLGAVTSDLCDYGEGPHNCSTVPLSVSTLSSGVTLVDGGDEHTCAITTGGALKCWGHNHVGQVGDGTITDRSTPVDVCASGATPPCTASNGNTFTGVFDVAGGSQHTCALITGGAAKCWGIFGSLGIGPVWPEKCEKTPDDMIKCSTKPVLVWKAIPTPAPTATITLTPADTLTPTDTPTLTPTPDPTDTDGDGCSDQRENGTDERLGGMRDWQNPNDFYDVYGPGQSPGPDGVIDLPNDVLGVLQHFSPDGAGSYDVVFDRGPSTGPDPWNMTAPDTVIDLPNDILGVIMQFSHRCQ